MATLATFFRRSDLMAADFTSQREAADPYRLRTLPGDQIYFYSKRIDNSRLIREANPKTRTDCWSAIASACVIAGLIGTAVSPRIGGVLAGYHIQKLKAENRQLLDERRMLEIDEAQLVSPARLTDMASRQNLSYPVAGQETRLQPKDDSLAMNVAPAAASSAR